MLDLHPRQIEFLRLVVEDITYQEIADRMFVSKRTVDGYAEDLLFQFNLRSRIGLIRFSVSHGIGVIPILAPASSALL
jgi:DNA-binding CsgD family transcriptional regulator